MVERAIVKPFCIVDASDFRIREYDRLYLVQRDDGLHLNAAFKSHGVFIHDDRAHRTGITQKSDSRIDRQRRHDEGRNNIPLRKQQMYTNDLYEECKRKPERHVHVTARVVIAKCHIIRF